MIDNLDKNIILQLQDNARLSNVALAKLLNASERTIRNRIAHLTEKGIIGTTAIPNLEMLGFNFMGIVALQIRLADLRRVAAELVQHPNICYLVNVTGRYDLIGIVVTRTAKEYSDFVENTISAIPSVIRTETFISLNIYKGKEVGLDTAQIISNYDIPGTHKI